MHAIMRLAMISRVNWFTGRPESLATVEQASFKASEIMATMSGPALGIEGPSRIFEGRDHNPDSEARK